MKGGWINIALKDGVQAKGHRFTLKVCLFEFNLLIATNVAARELNIPNISHVINYDLPETKEAYTHRVGKTGKLVNRVWLYVLSNFMGDIILRNNDF